MGVTSYLSLYTTLLGWEQYQNLWSIMTTTGLVYLPFLGILVTSCVMPFTSMGAKDAAVIAVRRMTLNVIGALFIIALAGVPTVNLAPTVLHYEPLCQVNSTVATPGHTGTTYDNAFSVPTGVKVPILWYLVMAVSNGVTHAANVGLSCDPIDYRDLHNTLNVAQITDTTLKQSVVNFYNQCYVPSKSRYLGSNLTQNQQSLIQTYVNKYGKEDASSLGSQIFLNVQGFYDSFHAMQPVTGFAFSPSRDAVQGQVSGHSQWGEPMCNEWWSDPSHGLATQLLAVLPSNVTGAMNGLSGVDQINAQQAAFKTLIQQSFNQSFEDEARGYESLEDNMKGDYITRFVGEPIGIGLESLTFYPKLHLLINALPIIQASLLFALTVFIAIGLPFSSFKMSFCITVSIVFFSLIFCSFIWHLVAWFDNHLIAALYPSRFDLTSVISGVLTASDDTPNARFVDMIIGTLYVVLPLVWMTVMSWASVNVGSGLMGSMGTMGQPANSAGSQAGGIAKTAITKSL
jgi:hypothetical protein